MNRSDLIDKLAAGCHGLPASDVEIAIRQILNSMARNLSAGNRIEIRGFGSFALNYRPQRTGRNPKTGAAVNVPPKYIPHFKAGKELRDRVDARSPAAE